MPETRQYELVYVINPNAGEEAASGLHAQVEEIVKSRGGQIDKTDNWGRRRLAYEIDRNKEGTYVLQVLSGPGAMVGELDRRLKVADGILRYLIVRVDEDLRKAEHARSRRQARRQRRRAARGLAPEPVAAATEAAVAEPAAGTAADPVVASEPAAATEPAAASEPAGASEPAAASETTAASEPAAPPEEAAASEPAAAPEPAAASDPAAAPETAPANEPAAAAEPAGEAQTPTEVKE